MEAKYFGWWKENGLELRVQINGLKLKVEMGKYGSEGPQGNKAPVSPTTFSAPSHITIRMYQLLSFWSSPPLKGFQIHVCPLIHCSTDWNCVKTVCLPLFMCSYECHLDCFNELAVSKWFHVKLPLPSKNLCVSFHSQHITMVNFHFLKTQLVYLLQAFSPNRSFPSSKSLSTY